MNSLVIVSYTFASSKTRICKYEMIPCKKISILSRWHHCFIFNFNIRNINESGLKFLKIKMKVHKIFTIFSGLWYCKLKNLLIPTLTNPTNISKSDRLQRESLSPKYNIIAINMFSYYGMQWCNIFTLWLQKSFRINISKIAMKMKTIYFLIFM